MKIYRLDQMLPPAKDMPSFMQLPASKASIIEDSCHICHKLVHDLPAEFLYELLEKGGKISVSFILPLSYPQMKVNNA